MVEYSASVEGIPQWRKALQETLAALDGATRRATADGALLVEREIKLILRLTSHKAGTPTPSAPGSPPSYVTGFLARSSETRSARPDGAWRWHSEAGPTAVYSRIQELGGYVHIPARSWQDFGPQRFEEYAHIPARPYVKPVYERVKGPIRNNYQRGWAEVLGR
jgi:hypothetical protein